MPSPARTYEEAVALYRAGDLRAAEAACLEVLRGDAVHTRALFMLGALAHAAARYDDALEFFGRAAQSPPDDPTVRNALGAAHLSRGSLAEARECFEAALCLQPEHVEAQINLATVLKQEGRLPEAVEAFERVLGLVPLRAEAHLNMGVALRELGQTERAAACFEEAARLGPELAEAHNNLGLARESRGDTEGAARSYERALAIRPDFAEAHNNLGNVHRLEGRLDEAAARYDQALRLKPDLPQAHFNLGLLRQLRGDDARAAGHYLRSLELQPDNRLCRRSLLECLNQMPGVPDGEALRREVERCFESPGVDRQSAARPAVALLKRDESFRRLLKLAADDGDEFESALRRGDFDDQLAGGLFLGLLRETVLTDLALERLLTRLRADFLRRHCEGDCLRPPGAAGERLACALALQCFNNEYVFPVTREEARRVGKLRREVARELEAGATPASRLQQSLAVLAMYEPLHALSGRRRLLEVGEECWSPPARALFKRHLRDHADERELAASFESLAPVTDGVTLAVQKQYEENPYPRWLSLNRHTPQTPAALLRTLFPHFSPPAFLDAGVRVLVAGCGTGKHALSVATRFRDADVLALDVSRASLAYAARSARELAVTNVAFRRGDILDLSPEVAGEFQLVECVGVLHHMREPEAGCERLVSVLQTGGVLKLGLYSERARAAVTAARARFARARAGVTPGVVRRFREEVKRRREEGDAEAERLTSFFDFYTLSDCRDLVFHVQEQCFTLPRVAAMLKRFGLRFVGFEFASPSAAGLYRKCFPEDDAMMSLSNWEELERDFPHLFAAMYQFWCQKV